LIINLTYYHVAKDVSENSPDIAVVIDVLRATTTISWALKNGADSIQVFADLDLLKESAIKLGAIINIGFFEINSKTRFLISYTKLTNNYCKHQP